jgi:hypothetical protein
MHTPNTEKLATRRIGPATAVDEYLAEKLVAHPIVLKALQDAERALEAVQRKNARDVSRAYEAAVLDTFNTSPGRVKIKRDWRSVPLAF